MEEDGHEEQTLGQKVSIYGRDSYVSQGAIGDDFDAPKYLHECRLSESDSDKNFTLAHLMSNVTRMHSRMSTHTSRDGCRGRSLQSRLVRACGGSGGRKKEKKEEKRIQSR